MLQLRYKTTNFTYENAYFEIANMLNDNLFELLSCILAEGLYRQILVNKKQGLINLKEIMKHEFLNDMPPDFSFINLDNDKLIQISSNMMQNKIKKLK